MYIPRNDQGVVADLARWFGGRLSNNTQELISGKVLASLKQKNLDASIDDFDGMTM